MAVAIDATGGAVDATGATRGPFGTTGARKGTREGTGEQASGAPSPPAANAPPAAPPAGTPAVVLDDQEVSGIVGKSVRSNADEDMGRIVDVIVSQDGHIRAAIIDFGGFLGIGTRKIAVDWRALKFWPAGRITLELTRNQVRVAPEYKRGEPMVVLGPAGPERTTPSTEAATPEK